MVLVDMEPPGCAFLALWGGGGVEVCFVVCGPSEDVECSGGVVLSEGIRIFCFLFLLLVVFFSSS